MLSAVFHPHRNYLARAQDGLLHVCQLTDDLEVDPDTVARWRRTGRIKRWYRGVYSDATLPETWRRWLRAGLLRLGPDAVVAGRAAAALWGLAGFDRLEVREFLVPRANAPRLDGATVVGVSALPPADVTTIGGLRATAGTATLHSLHRFGAREAEIVRAAGDACRRGRTSEEQIARYLASRPKRRGNAALRIALEHLDEQYACCRSVAEVDGHTFLRHHGFTGYVINDRVRLTCGRTVEFDVHFTGRRKVVEWDGAAYHGSPLEQQRDRSRDDAAARDGYRVLRVPVAELRHPTPLAGRIRRFLGG